MSLSTSVVSAVTAGFFVASRRIVPLLSLAAAAADHTGLFGVLEVQGWAVAVEPYPRIDHCTVGAELVVVSVTVALSKFPPPNVSATSTLKNEFAGLRSVRPGISITGWRGVAVNEP